MSYITTAVANFATFMLALLPHAMVPSLSVYDFSLLCKTEGTQLT